MNVEEGKAFGKISNIYDSSRTSYPSALIDDILNFSGTKIGRVLDIGCGTGQVTALFDQKGFSVTGLDISQEMINIAKVKCSGKTDFVLGTFEGAKLSEDYYDIITSGMAWHWVASKDRYEKLHRILKNNGTVAIFWSHQQKEKSQLVKNVGKILDKYGGINRGPAGSLVVESFNSVFQELKESNLFTSVEKKEYEENIEFNKLKYINLVISYGWVQKLSADQREDLINNLKELFEQYTEPLIIPYKYLLVLARK
ncbi:MAG: methyltransferase domain-containing protein [Candidatus Woesearchaeota archaeon]|jgi:ubiquinone/menaquinone biosynthesis C-methylase UbiE